MGSNQVFHVAIVGGGLGGLALGIALAKRNIPFTLYESRGSFTEIGAGINLGPNAVRALRLIDPSLGDKISQIATRNPEPYEHTWMLFKRGADSSVGKDGETIAELSAPPTGNMTLHRQELLGGLAETMGSHHARFNKKLTHYEQNSDHVVLKFADGTSATASVLVGCDGVHSRVRSTMFGENSPVTKPTFTGFGTYRAVIPMEQAVEAWGESGRCTQALLGPNGYFIYYPVNGGTAVNCGLWILQEDKTWPNGDNWVLPHQGEKFREQSESWGPRIHKMLQCYPDPDPAMWGSFEHGTQSDHFHEGRVSLIGDGAHAMPPHQAQGATQAVEDAFVLAEVLSLVNESDQGNSADSVEAALRAVEDVRKPRFTKVHGYSSHAGHHWAKQWEQNLEGRELEEWTEGVRERLRYIWDVDIEAHAEEAKKLYRKLTSTESKM